MTQLIVPRDVEAMLAQDLGVHAPPVPQDLGDALPYAVATRVGGNRVQQVVDTHAVSFDVWALTDSEAMEEAGALFAEALSLPRAEGTSVAWLAVTADSLPYGNPDPLRPDLARATFTLRLTCKAQVE